MKIANFLDGAITVSHRPYGFSIEAGDDDDKWVLATTNTKSAALQIQQLLNTTKAAMHAILMVDSAILPAGGVNAVIR